MAWKPTGRPTVRQQRDKWVVRVDGLDTESGTSRPRQLGTYRSRRAAQMAATEFAASGDTGTDRSSVGFLVDQWVASRTDVSSKTKMQYEWAAGHIRAGHGPIRVDRLDRLDRSDVAQWLDELAAGGKMGRRSISIFRMVLRAALADAVESGDLRRSPAARVAMPRAVVKPDLEREVDAWDDAALAKFLHAIDGHRWEGPFRLAVMYGLRRSELLGLRWSAVDLKKGTGRIERALIEVHGRPEWSDGKNARSRRTIPVDPTMVKALTVHRRFQAEERIAAGDSWNDNDLVVATRHGNPVSPGNFDQTLDRLVAAAAECRASPRTGFGTPPRPTWSVTPMTSARSVRRQICSATAPTC